MVAVLYLIKITNLLRRRNTMTYLKLMQNIICEVNTEVMPAGTKYWFIGFTPLYAFLK